MATTEKGICYPDNYDSIADVPKDLEKMAKSIDVLIQETTENINKTIKNNDSKQEDLINKLQQALIDGEKEGEDIYIDDASGAGKIQISGNYKQKSGSIQCVGGNKKNLFSLDNKLENATVSIGDMIVASDSYDLYYVEVEQNEEYVLSFKINEDYKGSSKMSYAYLDEIPQIGMEAEWYTTGSGTEVELNNKVFQENKKYFVLSFLKQLLTNNYIYDIQLEKGTVATDYAPYGQGSINIIIENEDETEQQTKTIYTQQEMLTDDTFIKEADGWKEVHNWAKIDSYNGESITTDYISSTGDLTTGATVYYKLETPQKLTCTETQSAQLEDLENITMYKLVTHIYSTDTVSPIIKLTYVKDLEAYINKSQEEQNAIIQQANNRIAELEATVALQDEQIPRRRRRRREYNASR